MYEVILREFERGWGNRVDEIKKFDDETEALEFIRKYNAKNTEKTVPDWYMIAEKGW